MPAGIARERTRTEDGELGELVDMFRLDASRRSDAVCKARLGQFLTPLPVARFMASMTAIEADHVRILDAGAGVGSLFSAVVEHFCKRKAPPTSLSVVAYELDDSLCEYLQDTIRGCHVSCERNGIRFAAEVRHADFLASAADSFGDSLLGSAPQERFNLAIQNPPYYKIRNSSRARKTLQRMGIETTNIYTGFLAVTSRLLEKGGELIAITARSFFNGAYFLSFRRWFLKNMALRRIHSFDSRQDAFREDTVLQETVIVRAIRGSTPRSIEVTTSAGPTDMALATRTMTYQQVVLPDDPQHFIRIHSDDLAQKVSQRLAEFKATLVDLDVTVSTGRVVDFRAKGHLRNKPGRGTVPLIYPSHFHHNYVAWPNDKSNKPNAIIDSAATDNVLVPNDTYVLVKRFSAKEERRRIVAAVYDKDRLSCRRVGFENHLNYFHRHGAGLTLIFARGLAAFLNSTLVDQYFRQFSGHTQVNATDLRNMRYPLREQLEHIGAKIGDQFPNQDTVDSLVNQELLSMGDDIDPVQAMKRIEEGIHVLRQLGFPRAQLNERSSLTLLALLDLKPNSSWSASKAPLRGITPMMDFFAEQYGKRYAPNTRETVRRQTVHQFLDAGIIIANPDKPDRPVNSPKAVYQIEPGALELLRTYGSSAWEKTLRTHLASMDTLKTKYAEEREMTRLPVTLSGGKTIALSPGGQNVLVQQIIEEFATRFTPGGKMIYVGDTDTKFAHFDAQALKDLGVEIETHGKMPDVIIHYLENDWLVLIEAVTSHGPVDPKRKRELKNMFRTSTAGLVFVTAFLTRKAMIEYLNEISWETEVWVADSPSHMIHFNGERFLGPY